jgi:Rrf2 family protein
MKLSANEEYGLRCLVRIGYAGEGGSLTIPEMSQAEGVSPAYAAKILRVLRKGGFVKAARGKDGGYTLARPAEAIVIGDVMDASAAASSKAASATATPARRPSAPAPWIAPCVPSGAPSRWPSTRCSAKPPCAICCRTKKR